jgi:hypothetical protein
MSARRPGIGGKSLTLSATAAHAEDKPNWCWVACGVMVIKAMKAWGYPITQEAFVKVVKGHTRDCTGTPADIVKGLSNWGIGSSALKYWMAWELVDHDLSRGRPVVARYLWTSNGNGHVVVIYETFKRNGEGWVRWIDPLDDASTARKTNTHAYFRSNQRWVWTHSVRIS